MAGEPGKSKLIQAVSRKGEFPMPPKSALPPEAVASLTEWVKSGAVIPADRAATTAAAASLNWAFQPVHVVPSGRREVPNEKRRNDIDALRRSPT